MKTAVCYYSRHHGNTLKILQAMAQEGEMDLIDVTARQTVQLDGYDCIGFASGIYGFAFQKAVTSFARRCLPQGKPVFFVYTYGGAKGTGAKEPAEIAREKGCTVLGNFPAEDTIPSAPSSWWAASPKGIPMRRIWNRPAAFTVTCKKPGKGWRENETDPSL